MWNQLLVTGCFVLIIPMVTGSSVDNEQGKKNATQQKQEIHLKDQAKEEKLTKQKRDAQGNYYYPRHEYVPQHEYYPEVRYEEEPCEYEEPCEHYEPCDDYDHHDPHKHHDPPKHDDPHKHKDPLKHKDPHKKHDPHKHDEHHKPAEYYQPPKYYVHQEPPKHEHHEPPKHEHHYTTTTAHPYMHKLSFKKPLLDLLAAHTTTLPPHHEHHEDPHHALTTQHPNPFSHEHLSALLGSIRDHQQQQQQQWQSTLNSLLHPHQHQNQHDQHNQASYRSEPNTCGCMDEVNQLQHAILLLQESVRQLKISVEAEEEAVQNGKTKVVKSERKAGETQ